jgi:hypothetical protein
LKSGFFNTESLQIDFYRKCIPNFVDIAVPLTDLTKKNVPNKVQWLDIHQESFDKLKGEICKDSVLKNPDFNRKCILQTDASQIGMGAMSTKFGIHFR